MGRLSDKKRSSGRPGKRERARVKNFRGSSATISGAGTFHFKSGRKKWHRFNLLAEKVLSAHQAGNLILNEKILSRLEERPDISNGSARTEFTVKGMRFDFK